MNCVPNEAQQNYGLNKLALKGENLNSQRKALRLVEGWEQL